MTGPGPIAGAVVAALLLVGCTASGASTTPLAATPLDGSPSATPAASQATAAPSPTGPAAATAASPQPTLSADATKSVGLAKAALAKKTGTAADQIQIISVTSTRWPTSALGCPQPGMFYSQLVTPGYRIVLQAGGQTYEYHSDRGRRVVYCAKP